MSLSKLFFVLLILSVSATLVFTPEASAAYNKNVVASTIDRAEAAMVSAYEAVVGAEQAGADVSSLLARLNVAGEYLANAHIWYELGDYDNATLFADQCYDIAWEVKNDAFIQKNEAYSLWVTGLVVTMTGSIIGVVWVVFLSLLGWSAFKRRYHKRILRMKPEVASGET